MIALFLAIAWFPTDAMSAVGDLSWVNPAIVTIVAMIGSVHALLIAAPLFGRLTLKGRIAAASPVVLVLASALTTYVRA
ncbi:MULTISPECIES: hypothetical protein [Lysobacter]|uniref:hypothetical protein n=1 Tax=Lysobacter TaxID=68 RepID=UPI001F42DD99|nr:MULTISPECIES: hypothetical protein [Lysobacter]UJB19199.1 hypothetical protein L1A79_23285 [Lysobacter capsici]UJQ27076.1 hypothetical protein L2D09_16600 [Lysobacter gummosus]